jgi:hypothetical protein
MWLQFSLPTPGWEAEKRKSGSYFVTRCPNYKRESKGVEYDANTS